MLVKYQEHHFDSKPRLSIVCLTYNHEHYIRESIESFLNQDVDFNIEILIHDDASTDNTAKIIKEFEKLYPFLIKPVYEEINQYSIGGFAFSFDELKRAKGEYIALCEGDDYWIDSNKLQKQIKYLEENKDCSMCFHASRNFMNNDIFYIQRPKIITKDYKYDMKYAMLFDGGFMATNSMLFLNKHILELPKWVIDAPAGDFALTLLLASKGKIGYIDEIMSAYRVLAIDSWSTKLKNRAIAIKHYNSLLKMLAEFDVWSTYRFSTYVLFKKSYYKLILCLVIAFRIFESIQNRLKNFVS